MSPARLASEYWGGVYFKLCVTCLIAFVAIGAIAAAIRPPFQVPDEFLHWDAALVRDAKLLRGEAKACSTAAAITSTLRASGVPFKRERKWPRARYDLLADAKAICVEDEIPYGNVLTYPGVLIVETLTQGLHKDAETSLESFHLARILSGLIMALMLWRLTAASLKSSGGRPVPGLLTLLTFSLSPLLLQQSFGISADGVINAATIACLTVFVAGAEVEALDMALLAVFGFAAATTKPVIAPLFLGFAIACWLARPVDVASAGRRRPPLASWLLLVLIAACFGEAFYTWGAMTSAPPHPGINSALQIAHIRESPLEVLGVLYDNLISTLDRNTWVAPLGWNDTDVTPRVINDFGKLFGLGLMVDAVCLAAVLARRFTRPVPIASIARVTVGQVMVLVGAAVTGLVTALTLYIAWTKVGELGVEGVQRRYHYPVAFAYLMTLAPVALWWRQPVPPEQSPSEADAAPARGPRRPWLRALVWVPIVILTMHLLVYCTRIMFVLESRYY